MLDQLPDAPFVRKVVACYPGGCPDLLSELAGKLDVILTYSVVQYVFVEARIFDFVDRSLELLADGGAMLIGDIPNSSRRKRFFRSAAGVKHHQAFTNSDAIPHVEFNTLETGRIDDAVVLGLLARCRSAGFDAFVVPQADDLPMANRREDVLIRKP
jgi:hypothetical protein